MKKEAGHKLSLARETLAHLDALTDSKLMAARGGATLPITVFCNPIGSGLSACDQDK